MKCWPWLRSSKEAQGVEPHELIEGHNTADARFSFHDDLLTVYDMVKAIYAACGPCAREVPVSGN